MAFLEHLDKLKVIEKFQNNSISIDMMNKFIWDWLNEFPTKTELESVCKFIVNMKER